MVAGVAWAVLAPWHVERSKSAIRERFADRALIDADRICGALDLTRFPVQEDEHHRETDPLTQPLNRSDSSLIGSALWEWLTRFVERRNSRLYASAVRLEMAGCPNDEAGTIQGPLKLFRKQCVMGEDHAHLRLGAAFFALPTSAFSQAVEFGPGGVRIHPYHRHYGYGADCRELREACLRKEELGEEGRGNCRRYREVCRGY